MKPHIKAAKEQGRQLRAVQFVLWVITVTFLVGAVFLVASIAGCLTEDAKQVKERLER